MDQIFMSAASPQGKAQRGAVYYPHHQVIKPGKGDSLRKNGYLQLNSHLCGNDEEGHLPNQRPATQCYNVKRKTCCRDV